MDHVISLAQRLVGDTWIGRWAARAGLAPMVRARRYRRLLHAGVYETTLLGEPLRFVVDSPTELIRIDAFWRERELAERILATLRPGELIWDIGANIGVLSMLFAARLAPSGGVVHAFEPEQRNAARLRANRDANTLSNLVIHQTAVGAVDGETTLYVSGDVGAGNHTTLHGAGAPQRVGVTTGREIRDASGDPGVVKIDVEGAEGDVVEGLSDLLSGTQVHDVFIELHPPLLCLAGRTPQEVSARLTSCGFRRVWSCERGDEVHEHYCRDV